MIMGKYNLCKSVKSVGLKKNNLWDNFISHYSRISR